jgi:hypothetical protein
MCKIYVVAHHFLIYVLVADTRSFAIFAEHVQLAAQL